MSRKKFSSRERRGIIALFAILAAVAGLLVLTRRQQPEGDMRPYTAIPSHLYNPSDSSIVPVDSSGLWSTGTSKEARRRKNGKKKKMQKKQQAGTGKTVSSRNPRMEEIPTD